MKHTICKLTAGAKILAFSLLICLGLGGCQKDADLPTGIEAEILEEMNYARTNRNDYIKTRLEPLVEEGDTSSYQKALAELIDEMKSITSNLKAYNSAAGLQKAAKGWVEKSGPLGIVGHEDGWTNRIKQYCTYSTAGENCSYGSSTAKAIVLQLLIDDGVESRGHRRNILSPVYTHVGIAVGTHKKYKTMCCMDFASGYKEK